MSDIINILPDSVANQIAAGEVVERPSSAVKELLENAIDAGATAIQLHVKDAGRTLIQVIDNGCGMSDADAVLCFERHATSKIHQAEDLFDLHTMGFRGEALASIASIAQVEMKTRLHDAELGTCIEIEGSVVKSQSPCNCPMGTSIAVKSLFFNLPARRNFLKKDSIEMSHIDEVFRRVALAHPDVAFSLHSNGRLLYDLAADTLPRRINGLFGNNMNERLYRIEEQSEIVNIEGYVSKPEFAKKTRGEQYLFVNGRYIRHIGLSSAIERAYTDIIPERYYPSYFVMLQVDPQRIDVNIHPTKTEVKFIDEHALFAILRAATKKAIGQFSLDTEIEFNPSTEIDFTPAKSDTLPPIPQISYNPEYNPFRSTTAKAPSFHAHSQKNDWMEHFFEKAPAEEEQPHHEEMEKSTLATSIAVEAVCIQVQNHWIVSTMPSGLLVVDQERAHERILFDRLMQHNKQGAAQQLLFPVQCAFTPADAELFGELLPEIQQYGFVIEPLGHLNYVVSATPADIKESELQSIFDTMIADYKSCMIQKFGDRKESLCRSLAHQMAVKVGTPLQQQEMQQIVADLFSCANPQISPSGKKTMRILNLDEENIGLKSKG